MANPSISLPGYTDLTGGKEYTRIGVVSAVRVVGPFDARGENSITHINDGWLCKGEDGHLFGVEDAAFAGLFAIKTNVIATTAGAGGAIGVVGLTPEMAPDGTVPVPYGDDLELQVIPELGFDLETLLVDGQAAVLTGDSYTFTNVIAPHTIAATFVAE